MGVCVVLVGDTVVVAVVILTTVIACTFEPLWSGTDLGHMRESSAPLALVHAAHWRTGRGWRFLLVLPSSVRTTIKCPPRSHIWSMHDERNDEAVVAAANTVAVSRLLLMERLLPYLPLLVEQLLPHLPTAM